MSKQKADAKASKVKAEKVAPKADAVHAPTLKRLIETSARTIAGEYALLEPIAKAMLAGRMSVRGFSATIEKAEADGGRFATIKASMGAHIIACYELSLTEGAPRDIASLFSIVNAIYRTTSDEQVATLKAEGVVTSKADAVTRGIATERANGATFEGIASKAKADYEGKRKARPNDGSKSGDVEAWKVDAEGIRAMAGAVTMLKLSGVNSDVVDALVELRDAVDAILNAPAKKVKRTK